MSGKRRVIRTVLVLPTPLALLAPQSVTDPVAELRAACQTAVATLPGDERIVVLARPVSEANVARGVTEPLGHRVAEAAARRTCISSRSSPCRTPPQRSSKLSDPTTLLVMADGSACRGDKAPGHLHPAALPFDDGIEAALRTGDAKALATAGSRAGGGAVVRGRAGLPRAR